MTPPMPVNTGLPYLRPDRVRAACVAAAERNERAAAVWERLGEAVMAATCRDNAALFRRMADEKGE